MGDYKKLEESQAWFSGHTAGKLFVRFLQCTYEPILRLLSGRLSCLPTTKTTTEFAQFLTKAPIDWASSHLLATSSPCTLVQGLDPTINLANCPAWTLSIDGEEGLHPLIEVFNPKKLNQVRCMLEYHIRLLLHKLRVACSSRLT